MIIDKVSHSIEKDTKIIQEWMGEYIIIQKWVILLWDIFIHIWSQTIPGTSGKFSLFCGLTSANKTGE